jgi:Ser/Thr protein kinase RdoA (MazF antagonist)
MSSTVEQALTHWGILGAHYKLIAARENEVYKVTTAIDTFALRLHRQGYRTDTELWSELKWMEAVSAGGIKVPAPIASTSGDVLHVIGGVQVDVLTWMVGETLDVTLAQQETKTRIALLHTLGQNMARLHDLSDAWDKPKDFARCAWDIDGLLGEAPLWDRFWDNPALTSDEYDLFNTFRHRARADLTNQASDLGYGLIHADLVAANVMVNGTDLNFIDFDDGGYGYRVFEVATALLKHIDAPDYLHLKQALIDGYSAGRATDLGSLSLFMALRAATYVGWNIKRTDEDGGAARNARFINTAAKLAAAYLD